MDSLEGLLETIKPLVGKQHCKVGILVWMVSFVGPIDGLVERMAVRNNQATCRHAAK